MSKVLKSSNKFLMSGGRWLTREYVPPPPPPPTRYVHLNQSTGGTISASPMSGVDGDTVTLSNTPSTNYTFNGYSVNGATLYSGNKFDFSGSDVTCSASWTYTPQILIDATYLTYFNSPTPKNTSSIYTWTDNPVICVPSNTPVFTNHMATGYTYSSTSKIDNQLVQLDGNYSGKTGIRSNIPEVGRMYTIGRTTYSSMGLDTHFEYPNPDNSKVFKSMVFRFKVDLSSALVGNYEVANFATRAGYSNLCHLACWYDKSRKMGMEFYIPSLDRESVQQTLTLYNGAKYPSTRSYTYEDDKNRHVTLPGTTKNVWHQCAIVYDNGDCLNLFVDGVLYLSCIVGANICHGIGCEGQNYYGDNNTPAYITEFLLTNYDIRTSPTTCMTWDTPLI